MTGENRTRRKRRSSSTKRRSRQHKLGHVLIIGAVWLIAVVAMLVLVTRCSGDGEAASATSG